MLRATLGALMCAGLLLWGAGAAAQGPHCGRLLDLAEDYHRQGRYLEALSFYRDIDRNGCAGANHVRLYAGMADIQEEYLGDSASARRQYEKALELAGPDADVAGLLHRLARACFRSGDRRAAESCYRRLMTGFPDYSRDNRIEGELGGLDTHGLPSLDVVPDASRAQPRSIRVLIEQTEERISVSCNREMRIFAPPSGEPSMHPAGALLHLSASGGAAAAGGTDVPVSGRVRIEPREHGLLQVQGRTFRGALEVIRDEGRLLAVNCVDLEEYLYGVLPKEMSPSWPAHALKAQAIAARTYALYHMIKRADAPYDVFSTTASQVYGGRTVEHPAVIRAVDETRGRILTCGDRIVLALYHANSGGTTGSVEAVWGSPVPCLQSVADAFSREAPGSVWDCRLSAGDIAGRLGEFGIAVSDIRAIVARERAADRRISVLELQHSGGSLFLSGNSFRLMTGAGRVKGTDFEVQRRGDEFVFTGRGYGHGVGMSQWGARDMARNGRDYEAILDFYYPGARLRDMHAP